MLAVFVAVRAEHEAVERRLEILDRVETAEGYIISRGSYREAPVVCCRTSLGEERVSGIVGRILDSHPVSAVVSVRICAGVPESLGVGQLVICPRLLLYRDGDDGITGPSGEGDLRLLELAGKAATKAGIGHVVGECLTVAPLMPVPVNRAALAPYPDIAVVDTEGYFVAEAAYRRGLPFLAVRASLGTVWDAVPDSITMLGKRGEVSPWGELARNLARPRQAPSYLRLREAVIQCSRSLGRFFAEFLPEWGKQPLLSPERAR